VVWLALAAQEVLVVLVVAVVVYIVHVQHQKHYQALLHLVAVAWLLFITNLGVKNAKKI
jgi:hypothetical protein